MKKVLIYMNESELKPAGGSGGYVYNLYHEMGDKRDFGDIHIDFIQAEIKKRKISKLIPHTVKLQIAKYWYVYLGSKILNDHKKKYSSINLNEYDAIHFHSTIAMALIKDSLKNYKGKVILNSHSPKALHKELMEDTVDPKIVKHHRKLFENLVKMDEYAFNRADEIIFPCPEAEEPYYHSWDDYKKIHEKNQRKYHYLPTGVAKADIKYSRSQIRKMYSIPEDAFLICYIGRHNETKGYDEFKKIARQLMNMHNDVYIICAGNQGPLYGDTCSRWIECGWIDYSLSVINASDVFVLPNKETYFDLIALEVLSVGQILVASRTGGNKYLENDNCNGIIEYDYGDIDKAVEIINDLYNKDPAIRKRMGEECNRLYDNKYSIKFFLKNYISLLENIFHEE